MTTAELVKLSLTASILLLVFALGLRATFADALTLFGEAFRPPYRLLRALLSIYVVVPAAAIAVALSFNLQRPVEIALVAMAVSPIPPILPGKQLKLGGDASYVFGLLVAVSLAAVVMVPLAVGLVGWIVGREFAFGAGAVAKLIGMSILLPLLAGMALRWFASGFAEMIAPWVSRLGTILLVLGLVPVLTAVWPALVSLVGDGTIVAILAVVAIAIAAGHWLAGPKPGDRTALAVASAMRHPAVAIAIATANVPDESRASAAILLFLLVAVIATSVYGVWRKRYDVGSGVGIGEEGR